MTRDDAATQVRAWQAQGLRVGFTSGVFDLLHVGHLDYLERARKLCDRLVVAVNTDASVRRLKGPSRPMVPDAQRLGLVLGLKPVDLAFLFDERNNNANIETLKPDLYIKAGDYSKARLSSASLVESYGGRVELVPLEHDTSSSALIETVVAKASARALPAPPREPRPAVFLDRDGVINEDTDFLHEPAKFRLLPGVIEGLARLRDAGFMLVVVTNQAGIGLGYFSHEDFFRVNRAMLTALSRAGILLERIYYCPHSEVEGCSCRKPAPGMLRRAMEELPVRREGSWMVGDREGDVEAGLAAGVRAVRVAKAGTATRAEALVPDLAAAAGVILAGS